jgi:molecular chaperone GrpE
MVKMNKQKKDTKIQQKKEEIDPKEVKISELTDSLQRLQAEFENYKKRTDKEKNEFVKYAEGKFILKILPILDSFELALKDVSVDEKFVKGMEMVFAQFYSVLESEEVRPIESIGKKFDPYKHEVLMKEFSDKEEDTVIEELQRGYMLNDAVLRHSKVKVSKGKKDDKKGDSAK